MYEVTTSSVDPVGFAVVFRTSGMEAVRVTCHNKAAVMKRIEGKLIKISGILGFENGYHIGHDIFDVTHTVATVGTSFALGAASVAARTVQRTHRAYKLGSRMDEHEKNRHLIKQNFLASKTADKKYVWKDICGDCSGTQGAGARHANGSGLWPVGVLAPAQVATDAGVDAGAQYAAEYANGRGSGMGEAILAVLGS